MSTNKKKIRFGLLVVLVAIAIGVAILRHASPAIAAWFDDNFMYRKAVSVSNSSGSNLTDFQVSLSIGSSAAIVAGKMQSDCDDIRVTDANGQLLPHWVETGDNGCNQVADTKVWTKVPSLPTSGATVYIYYGNPTAPSVSNGNQVFEFFDDFSSTTVDPNKWNTSGTPTISSGILSLSNLSYLSSLNGVTGSNGLGQMIVRAKQAVVNLSGGKIGFSSTNTLASDFHAADSLSVNFGNTEEKLTDFGGANKMGHFKLEETSLANGDPIDDASSNDADLQVVTGATSATGKINNGLTFNGSTQYLKQQVIDDATGASFGPTYHGLSLAANSAFMRVQGVDLSPYASAGNDYMIVVSDGEGDKAWGYIDLADAAEALGSELVTNGTMEADANWANFGAPSVNERSTTQVHGGTYSRKFTPSSTYDGIQAGVNFTTTTGKLYKVTAWIYPDDATTCRVLVRMGNDSSYNLSPTATLTQDTWNQVTYYYTEAAGGGGGWISFDSALNTSGDWYIDDVSIQEVTHVGIDGVHIMSTKGGSTQSWAGIDASFNYNASAYTFEVRETEFQITGAVTIGAWIKRATTGVSHPIITKHNTALTNGKSFYLAVTTDTPTLVINDATQVSQAVNSSVTVADTNWHYIVGVFSPSTYLKIYVDGVETGSNTTSIYSSIYDRPNSLDIGHVYWGGNGYMNGTIDEPFILSSALTEDQIKALYEYYTLSTSASATKTTPANTADGTNDTSYHVYTLTSQAALSSLIQDSTTLSTSTTNLPTVAQYARLQNTDTANALSVDWIAVIKPATASPTTTLSTEEQGGGPVAYWSFDDGSGTVAQDKTSNNNDGTLGTGSSAPTWQTEDMCVSGKCLKFDGNDYINITNGFTNTIKGNNTHTVLLWIKGNSFSNSPVVISDNSAKNKFFLETNNAGTQLLWGYGIGESNYRTYTSNISSGWHHIAMVKTGVGDNGSLYLDGILQNNYSGSLGSIVNTTGNLVIGRYGGGAGYEFNGFLDDIKIYPYARSAAQIKLDYNSRGTAKGTSATLGVNNSSIQPFNNSLSNGLVGYWNMDTGSGTTAADLSGNSNTATLGSGTSAPSWSTGMYGVGLSFDGNDYTSVSHATSVNLDGYTDSYSISVWTKSSDPAGAVTSRLIDKPGSAYPFSFQIATTDNAISAYLYDGTNNPGVAFGNVWNGNYHHLVLVVNQSTDKIYAYTDGVLYDSTTNTVTSTAANSNHIYLGNNAGPGTRPFSGLIDEIRIYNRALSPKEVRDLYNFAPGPVGYWKMDEGVGSSAVDSSSYGNTGTLGTGDSAPSWKSGKYGKALKFDGSSDYVSMGDPSNESLDFGTMNFTLMAWFKTGSRANGPVLIQKNMTNNGSYGVYLHTANGRPYIYLRDGNSVTDAVIGTTALDNNTWHHITVVFNRTGNATSYIDGIYNSAVNIANEADSISSNGNFSIGAISDGTRVIDGSIDDVKIYNYARSQKQIVEDMTAGHPAVSASGKTPVAYYKFDEGQGTVANNKGFGGSTLNGTLGAGTSAPTWTNNGKFGKALSFDGSNDYVNLTNIGGITKNQNAITLSYWIKLNNLPGANNNILPFIETNADSGYTKFGAQIFSDGSARTVWRDSATGTAYTLTSGTGLINTGQWYQITQIVDSDSDRQYIYINGIQKTNSNTASGAIFNSTPAYAAISGKPSAEWNTTEYINGLIDDVKIYNYALTEDEVKTEYNRGSSLVLGTLSSGAGNTAPYNAQSQEYCVPGDTAVCSPPVARWDFNEGIGTTAMDISGNGNTGTWSGTGTHWSSGKYGKAGKFNGSNDYVWATDSSTLDQSGNMTVEAWVNPAISTMGGGDVMLGKAEGGNYNYLLYFDITNDNSPKFYVLGLTDAAVVGTTNLVTDRWYHLVGIYDGSYIRIYVNGILEGADPSTGTPTMNNEKLGIGANGGGSYFFDGSIDQVRIYNYARTPAQIAWDYNRGAPILHYRMDECEGTTIHSATKPLNASLNGTLSIGASGTQTSAGTCTDGLSTSAWSNGATGHLNASLNFDGVDDYITLGDNASLDFGLNSFSISSWIKTSSSAATQLVAGKYYGYPLYYQRISSGAYEARIGTGAGNNYTASDGPAVNNGTWHNLVVTYNRSGNMTRYVDGKQHGSTVDIVGIVSTSIDNTNEFAIGDGGGSAAGGSQFFDGQIDDVRVYNYALTATQVKTLYNNGAVKFGN